MAQIQNTDLPVCQNCVNEHTQTAPSASFYTQKLSAARCDETPAAGLYHSQHCTWFCYIPWHTEY